MKSLLSRLIFGVFLVSCSTPATKTAYSPTFDPSQYKGPKNGQSSQVLVLGTDHLSGLPDTFKPDSLSPLIDRLNGWRPQIITIEAVSGPQCAFMRTYPERYKDSVETYCWNPAPAQTATGMTVAQATKEVERILDHWPDKPTAAERRKLASLFLASADRASALVQWLRLPASERHAGDGLDETLATLLNKLKDRQNENYLIAAPLAARLGLERLYPIDDHTADTVVKDEEAYSAAIGKAWANPATKKRAAIYKSLNEQIGSPSGLLTLYRVLNAPEQAVLVFKSDFGAALEEPSPQKFGRGYLGYWETRNLRMTANIRDILGQKPGARALVIIGASHKAYLEAYLNQMHDIRLVDAENILR